MADLNGIISYPKLGQYSDRTAYNQQGQNLGDYNIFSVDPKYTGGKGGYLYGSGDPTDPANRYQYSSMLTDYITPYKIIPSQWTQTAEQAVGPAQFQIGNQVTTQGKPPDPAGRFTASAPSVAASTQAINPQQQGFIFGDKFMAGSFGNNTPGQSTTFYANQPSSTTASNPSLGVATPWTPQQQALIKARGY